MLSDLEFECARFRMYERAVIQPAIVGRRSPLDIAVFQCADHRSIDDVRGEPFQSIDVGYRWGPAWSTAWFQLKGNVPNDWNGSCVALRFSSGTEALLWSEDGPKRGFDRNRDLVTLLDPACGGEAIDLLIEAACNHPFGIVSFSWDSDDARRRWEGDTPGEVQYAELVEYHDDVRRLQHAFQFARLLIEELPGDSSRAHQLAAALNRAIRLIDDVDVHTSVDEVLEVIVHALRRDGAIREATQCIAIGHAHIDTAWLWPIAETKRKCLRTFANVIELMDRYPDFRFLCSQAQQYAWIEERSPELFARIATRVETGQWEPGGAMWVEPDCNIPSGESLVRQIMHGTRYWREKFGERGRQRFVYLPDTFGFPASLPQIMAAAGIDTFVTNKLAWSRFNDWPHVNFIWRGIDGSEVLAHCTPGHNYNASNSPKELRRGETNCAEKDRARAPVWLQPFGFGDGGGGPTAEMIESAQFALTCDGLPKVKLGRADAFCEQLHAKRDELVSSGQDLPVWDGELYLELHRGTYTTQSWLKQANRRAEESLRLIEWLLAAAPADVLTPARIDEIRNELDRVWKALLLNQFHDILPGSSIAEVYVDARRDHDRIQPFCDHLTEELLSAWSSAIACSFGDEVVIVNPSSHAQSGVVEFDGQLRMVRDAPVMSMTPSRADSADHTEPVLCEEGRLRNRLLDIEIGSNGEIARLTHRPTGRVLEGLNRMRLYEDRPYEWDAWDIDEEHIDKPIDLNIRHAQCRIGRRDALRAVIEVSYEFGRSSRMTQRFILDADSPRLDVRTTIDWHESHRLLRVEFPTCIRSRFATCDIQFGQVQRPMHANTTWERAMFEVCAHRWVDVSEHGFGLAILNDGKYGHRLRDGCIGVTLLRSSTHPDPNADRGRHEFTYSIMPHAGDWRSAGVDREAERLNCPFLVLAPSVSQSDSALRTWQPFSVEAEGAACPIVSAFKYVEDGSRRVVLRLVESHGGRGECAINWNLPVRNVIAVNLLEEETTQGKCSHDGRTQQTHVEMRPYQIMTLLAELAD